MLDKTAAELREASDANIITVVADVATAVMMAGSDSGHSVVALTADFTCGQYRCAKRKRCERST